MSTKTERENMKIIQNALGDIKKAAKAEIVGNKATGDAEHLNAWTHVLGKTITLHAEITDLGFEHFPEFFGGIVIKGGGGGR